MSHDQGIQQVAHEEHQKSLARMERMEELRRSAQFLADQARREGYVITISQKAVKPLAMRRDKDVVGIRERPVK